MPNICQYCNQKFTRKDNLVRHIKDNRCKLFKIEAPLMAMAKKITLKNETRIVDITENKLDSAVTKLDLEKFEKQISERFEKKIEELKNKPSNVTNNNLQIVCVGSNDNYLDMLTDQWQNFDKALEYIKDCALSQLSGDCKLVEKIYLSNEQKNIRYVDKSQTKIEYLNEKEELVRDTKELFGKKIANNLQNSYLKGVNYLLNNTLNNRLCPNKFLEEYDIQLWNSHIYELCDHRYQRKMVNQLNIPQA